MNLQILDVKLDKSRYVYGIDKNIQLTFSISSQSDEERTIKNLHIDTWIKVFCKKKEIVIDNLIIQVENKVILPVREIKTFCIEVPVFFPEKTTTSIKIENYLDIKIDKPDVIHKVNPKIIYWPSEYYKRGVKFIDGYKSEAEVGIVQNTKQWVPIILQFLGLWKKRDISGYDVISRDLYQEIHNSNKLLRLSERVCKKFCVNVKN